VIRGLGYVPEATGSLRRDTPVVTMYLSNKDVRPTGYEAGEFLEPVVMAPLAEPSHVTSEIQDEDEDISDDQPPARR